MELHTRLNVIEGEVLCPHSCQWKSAEKCAVCAELTQIEETDHGPVVVCEPDVERPFASVLQQMIHA
jgi:hypothetical protein